MKQFKFRLLIILAILFGLFVSTGLTSCSDDDDNSWDEGSKITLPSYRAFILCEGNMKSNNSHLTFLAPDQDTTYTKDIYEVQNGMKIGDTAEGMITLNNDIYYVVNYSRYIVRLNGSGVEQARFSYGADTDLGKKLGEPRFMAAENGKIYVTSYGGYVSRFDAKTLTFEDSVKTNANPEQIVYYNGNLYWVCSGYGAGNTMGIISVKNFSTTSPENVEIASNPYELQVDPTVGKMYFMAYDANYSSHVYSFSPSTKTYSKIGDATKMCANNGNLYFANSVSPDWVHYTTSYSVYHSASNTTESWNLTDKPETLTSKVVYMIANNPYDGSLYIGLTDYVSDATIYHFGSSSNYIASFSARGINPNSMVFIR